MLWSLCIAFSASGSGVSMPQKIGDEVRLAHLLENLRPLGDVERRLAGEPRHVAGPLLPLDQMRHQVQRRLAVADEIVIDEIHRVGHAAFAQLVEFGDDLLRRLEARIAAIEAGDVAEFALIGTAARILDAAEEILSGLGELIGRNRKLGHRQAVGGLQHHLLRRAATDRAPAARSGHWWHRRVRRHGDSRTRDSNPGRR